MSAMNPHVSDEQISDQFTFGPLIVDAMHGYLSGANFIRDLYEPLVTSQRERIAALEEALKDAADFLDGYANDESDDTNTGICSAFDRAAKAARALLTPKTTDPK